MLKRRQDRVAGECKSGCFGEFMCWRIGEFVHESIYKFASVFGVYPRFTTYNMVYLSNFIVSLSRTLYMKGESISFFRNTEIAPPS